MRLFEFESDRVTLARLVALTNQLKTDLDDGKISDNYTVDQLLDYFQDYDVILDVNDLYNMIKEPPLKDIIKNIQGDRVVFKGQQEEKIDKPATADNEKTVANMAKRALKI
jgi:hypothetical protein